MEHDEDFNAVLAVVDPVPDSIGSREGFPDRFFGYLGHDTVTAREESSAPGRLADQPQTPGSRIASQGVQGSLDIPG